MRRLTCLTASSLVVFVLVLPGTGRVWPTSAAADRPAPRQVAEPAGLDLTSQNFTVAPGGIARLEFVVTADVPEIAPTTTTTTTTTTVPPTVPPTVPFDPAAPAASVPGIGAPDSTPVPTATTPEVTTTTTTTTTLPPPPPVNVQVRAHRAITTRDQVQDAIDGTRGPVIDIVENALSTFAEFDETTGERRLVVDVPITPTDADADLRLNTLDLNEPGLYPVTVQIRRDTDLVAEYSTFLELVVPGSIGRGPFTFTAIAAVTDPGPDPDDAEIDRATTEIGRIVELAAASDAPVSVVLPPDLITRIGERDPDLVARLNATLTAEDTLITAAFDAIDPSSAAAAGVGDELEARFGRGERRLRDLFPLVQVARSGWLTDATLTTAGADLVRDLGFPMIVMPFDQYAGYGGSIPTLTDTSLTVNADLGGDGTSEVLLVDPADELLDADLNGEHTPLENAVHLMAITSAMRYQLDPDLRGWALTTPVLGAADPRVIDVLEQFVAERTDYAFAPLDAMPDRTNSFFLAGNAVTIELARTPTVDIADRVQRRSDLGLRIADVASMLPRSDERPAAWTAAADTALATGLGRSVATTRLTDIDAELDMTRNAVQPPESFPFTIAGRDANVPVRVENTGNTPLTVVLHLEAEKLTFPGGDVTATLAPNAVTAIPVPVSARSNGVFPVSVEVRTPAGNQLTQPVELTARVSTLAGLGRVFTGGALLVLATWWFSYFRRRRKEQRDIAIDLAQRRHPALGDVDTARPQPPGDH